MDPSQPVSSPASSCHLHALTGRVMSTMLGLRAHSPLWLCRPTLQMAACSFHTQTFTKCKKKESQPNSPKMTQRRRSTSHLLSTTQIMTDVWVLWQRGGGADGEEAESNRNVGPQNTALNHRPDPSWSEYREWKEANRKGFVSNVSGAISCF